MIVPDSDTDFNSRRTYYLSPYSYHMRAEIKQLNYVKMN